MSSRKSYNFTLVLSAVDENTPNLEDSLFETGCDDALINFRDGTVYLDFDREADSLEEAVLGAIQNIESSSVKAKVVSVAPEDLVTESETAQRLNVKRQAVSLWIKGERRTIYPFPKPIMKLSERSPLWSWRDIIDWYYKIGKLNDKELLAEAAFLNDLQAVLEERGDKDIQASRKNLLKKLEDFPGSVCKDLRRA